MFNGHVGNGQPPFDAERADDGSGIFDHMAAAACGTQHARDVQHDVLGGHTCAQFALDADFHGL